MRSLLVLAVGLMPAGSASAQVAPFPGSAVPYGSAIGDRHRYEMDRLRAQSDQRAALAARQQADTRLTLQQIQGARRTAPIQPEDLRPLGTIAEERARREAAAARRDTAVRGVTQIDGWLDRPRD